MPDEKYRSGLPVPISSHTADYNCHRDLAPHVNLHAASHTQSGHGGPDNGDEALAALTSRAAPAPVLLPCWLCRAPAPGGERRGSEKNMNACVRRAGANSRRHPVRGLSDADK
ncbi:hypothetical protein CH63R_14537 [Colletotrichum higginsianum IMI 349063]|uniref:Uncharacterized protein n=1 Tax=Colletotrichum higginsianum (strain IMI 349063) TaxID=759273 RepID=A0A1B7XQC5_COLHI|nr:hypothetical protein CH63R_14537 [Colletotrichum higginsianum IMI 349063]OBR01965.1 hypothetical protein CH63R_14537 [Colletotrichum higginsianum IMI 349063]